VRSAFFFLCYAPEGCGTQRSACYAAIESHFFSFATHQKAAVRSAAPVRMRSIPQWRFQGRAPPYPTVAFFKYFFFILFIFLWLLL
jgi:hypothetical protein